MSDSLPDLLHRVSSLESQLRRTRLSMSLLLIGLIGALVLGFKPQDNAPSGTLKARVVEATQFVLRDEEGNIRGGLLMEEGEDEKVNATLTLNDAEGYPRIRLLHNHRDNGVFAMYGKAGGRPSAAIGVNAEGFPAVRLQTPNQSLEEQEPRVDKSLRIDPDGLYLYQGDKPAVLLRKVNEEDKAAFLVFDQKGEAILISVPQ